MYFKYLLENRIEGQSAVFERGLKVWGVDLKKGDVLWSLYEQYSAANQEKLGSITRRRCC